MGLADVLPRRTGLAPNAAGVRLPDVVILEDDPDLAEIAAHLCRDIGLSAATFRTAGALLAGFDSAPPRVVVLDWRLERDVGAAAFMALRHRFADVPIVCWTGMPAGSLPAMVAADSRTRIVRKADSLDELEAAIRWACPTRPESVSQNREEKGATR
ncbi:MAG TPA: response regulator [Candidatus Limnocylindrales bacterium]|nr:response regulator [Candidatus Limnocylindrales bacterium]